MNEKEINSLNEKLTIHFPIDELAVYMHGSELDDKAVPILTKSLSKLGLRLSDVPDTIVFRSRWLVTGHAPDETMSLFSIKKNNPKVEFSKLKRQTTGDSINSYAVPNYRLSAVSTHRSIRVW